MDAAHIHLILIHFPIAGFAFSVLLLLVAASLKSEDLTRAGLALVLITGLLTIPTYLSGESAEEIIEHLPGVSENLIKIHEEAAEKAIWAVGISAVAALMSLMVIFRKKAVPKGALATVTFLSALSLALLGWTNNLGGQIRHPEIRKNASAGTATPTRSHFGRSSSGE